MDEVSLKELDELHSSILSLCEDICPEESHGDQTLAIPSGDLDQELFDDVRGNEDSPFILSPETGKRNSNYNIRLSPIRKERKEEDITPGSYSSTFEDSSFEFHCNEYTPIKTTFKRLDFESTPKVKPSLMGRLLKARSTSTPLFNKWNQPKIYDTFSSRDRKVKNQNFGNKIGIKMDPISEKNVSAADNLKIKAEVTNQDFEQTYDELLEDLTVLCQAELDDSLKCENIKVDSEPKSAIKAASSVSRISMQSILYDTKVKEEVSKINDTVGKNGEMSDDEETKKPGRFCGINTTTRSRTCVTEEHVEESYDILGLENYLLGSDDEDDLDLTESLDKTVLEERTVLHQREPAQDHQNEKSIDRDSALTLVKEESSGENKKQTHDKDDKMVNEKNFELKGHNLHQEESYKNVNKTCSKTSIEVDDEFELDLATYNDEVENFLTEERLDAGSLKAGKNDKAGIENKELVQHRSWSSVENAEIDDFLMREGFQIIDNWKCDDASASSPRPVSLKSVQIVEELKNTSPSSFSVTDGESGKTSYWPLYKEANGNSVKDIQRSIFKNKLEVKAVEQPPLEKRGIETFAVDRGISSLGTVKDKDVAASPDTRKREDTVDTQNLKRNVCVDDVQNVRDNVKKVCEVMPVKSTLSDTEITSSKESKSSSDQLCSNNARPVEPVLKGSGSQPLGGAECKNSAQKLFFSFPSPKISKNNRQSHPLSDDSQESVDIPAFISPKKGKHSHKKHYRRNLSFDENSRFDHSSHKSLKRRWSSSPTRNTSHVKTGKSSQKLGPKPLLNSYTGFQEEKAQKLPLINMHPCSSSSSTPWPQTDNRQHNSSPVQPEMVLMNQKKHNCPPESLKYDMESNGAKRLNHPSVAAHWAPKSEKRPLEMADSYERNDKKQNTNMFIDYRAERQFIQNENHLTRQVMNKWQSKGIQSPDTNLTFATKLRQRGQFCQSRLEGQRHSTLWLYNDNRSNVGQQNSQSVMNDINNLRQQLDEVNLARKKAVDNVVDECGMEKHRLGVSHGNRTRELYLQQEMEFRNFQSQRFINPYFLQCQLLQLKCEHNQQRQQLHFFMCKEHKALEESYETKIHNLVKRFDEKRAQLNSLIHQLENEKFTKDQSGPHVLTNFKSNYSDCSKVTVCLPAEIAASLVREEEVYDAYYSH